MSVIFVDKITPSMFAGSNAAIVKCEFDDGVVIKYAFREEMGGGTTTPSLWKIFDSIQTVIM